MNDLQPKHMTASRWLILCAPLIAIAAGCASGSSTAAVAPTGGAGSSSAQAAATSRGPTESASGATEPSMSQGPDTGTTAGDVPDNAVFLTYHDSTVKFSIQYVEGWQVTRDPNGVSIRDKDSSEVIQVVAGQTDVAAYISATDLPGLQAQAGFKLIKQDTVKVGAHYVNHLAYEILSPADPVTGKQVPSSADRYYMPGTNGLAVVSLSTPKGVDNVDAFRQMIESFQWA